MNDAPETTAMTAQTEERGLRLAGPRLPYHPALEDRYGIDRGTWKVLCEVLFPAAESAESVIMAVSYCKARNLDIMKKPVHIVPVWDKKRGKMVDTVWPAISETRITATRTGVYAGKDETVFGPEINETLGGVEVTYPEWASVTVYRFVHGVRCAFTGERIRWKEYYAKAKRDTLAPNEMWKTKAYSQASKCAEASALRCAFPEEDSGPTSDEMEGQEVTSTYAPDETINGPGIMARLAGNQHAEGFDAENGHATTEQARDGVRGKRKARKDAAAALPAPEAEVPATPVAETEPEAVVDAEVEERPTSAEAATETAGAPTVEPEAASQDSATDASTDTPATPEGPSLSPPDGQDADPEDVVAEGFPAVDEIYHLVGDAWEFDETRGEDRRDTYKNGQPFSDAGRDKGYAIYEDGGVLGGVEATSAEVEEETSTDLPPDFEAYVSSLDTVTSWAEVKTALQAFMKGVTWPAMPEDVKNRTRANTWFTLVEERKVEWLPSPAADVSAYRMWMETEQDAALVQSTFDSLTDTEAFKGANDATRQAIISATAARIDHLKG